MATLYPSRRRMTGGITVTKTAKRLEQPLARDLGRRALRRRAAKGRVARGGESR